MQHNGDDCLRVYIDCQYRSFSSFRIFRLRCCQVVNPLEKPVPDDDSKAEMHSADSISV